MAAATKKYIRNLRNVHASVRFKKSDNRVELAPRGQRGDLVAVDQQDIDDGIFIQNLDSLYELISATEAKNIVDKQTTNIQTNRHPALDAMTNALGEDYDDDAVKLEVEEQAQGKVVAKTKAVAEGVGDVEVTRSGITRLDVPGAQGRAELNIPDNVPPEQVADYVARQRNIEGPQAGLAGLTVTTTEPVKEKTVATIKPKAKSKAKAKKRKA